jgi:ABC-type multidrug transport system ATPase subunit
VLSLDLVPALQLLSLVNCADTVVGDGMIRGVSGGEKKRVTTGEVMVGPSKVLFMDEISTGLDSASTFTIVQSLANWAHATDATIVVALLQPEPQVYDQFDDVMLLSNGRIAYHGERLAVEPYFDSLGFGRPDKKAVADFLQVRRRILCLPIVNIHRAAPLKVLFETV